MQRIILTSFLFWMMGIASIEAQTAPMWLDSDMRRLAYPDSTYFTGYVEGNLIGNERIDVATQRLKDAARVEALSTIRVQVKNTTSNHAMSEALYTSGGTFRQSMREFATHTTTSVDVNIPGVLVDSWYNPDTKTIVAFAYLEKKSLVKQLENQIAVILDDVQLSLFRAKQLLTTGQKLEARNTAQTVMLQYMQLDELQKLLLAVDANVTTETLRLPTSYALQQQLETLLASLANGLNICIMMDATIFNAEYTDLLFELQGGLSPLGCTFLTDSWLADWVVKIEAYVRDYKHSNAGNYSAYFAYVDLKLTITNGKTGQCVYSNLFSEKGGHFTDFAHAAREAYKQLSPQVISEVEAQVMR